MFGQLYFILVGKII